MHSSRFLLSFLALFAAVVAPAARAQAPSPAPSLALQIAESADPVAYDGAVTYTITVQNQGAAAATNLELYCRFLGEAYLSTQQGAATIESFVGDDGVSIYRSLLPALQPGSSAEWSFTVELRSETRVQCAVQADGSTAPVEQEEVTRVEGTPPTSDAPTADGPLVLDVAQEPESLEVGGPVTYRVSLTNQGPAPQTNVLLQCLLPAEFLTFDDATGSTGVEVAGPGQLQFRLASLAPGAAAEWTLRARAAQPGAARVAFWLNADEMAQPLERAGFTIIGGDEEHAARTGGRVRLFLSQDDPAPRPGDLTYIDVSAVYGGVAPQEGAEVMCWIDTSLLSLEDVTGPTQVQAAGDGAILITVPTLTEGTEVAWRLAVRVLGEGPARTAAELRTPTSPASETANLITWCSAEPQGGEDAVLQITDDRDPAVLDDIVTYSIRVTHQGSIPLTGVVIRCALDLDRLSHEGDEGPTPSEHVGPNRFLFELPELRPGQTATWRMRMKAMSPGQAPVRARLHSMEFGGGPEVTETTLIQP